MRTIQEFNRFILRNTTFGAFPKIDKWAMSQRPEPECDGRCFGCHNSLCTNSLFPYEGLAKLAKKLIKIDYGEIYFGGKCNLKCFFCIGNEMESEVYEKTPDDFNDWKRFKEWISFLKEYNVPKIYLSSTSSEPLLYKNIDKLILFLEEEGFRVGIRTNASVRNCEETLSLCNEVISLSLQSLNPETFKKITKRNLNFDIIETIKNIKLKDNARLRVTIVVNRYNENEILDILDTLKDIKKIQYVQLRKVYKYDSVSEEIDFTEDFEAYQRVRNLIKSKFKKTGNFKESEIFDVNGLSVSLWDVVSCRESIQSSNFWTDGRVTFNNLLVPGYKEAKETMETKIEFEME